MSLTSDYTIKLQSSKQYDTGPKRETYRSMARIENPEINSCIYVQLIYNKEGKAI